MTKTLRTMGYYAMSSGAEATVAFNAKSCEVKKTLRLVGYSAMSSGA